jgi:hypothetical protein
MEQLDSYLNAVAYVLTPLPRRPGGGRPGDLRDLCARR